MSNVFGFRKPPPGFISEFYNSKTSSSTSTVQIPPEVLARYNAVNARAEEAAKNPFQPYGGQFVAGLTPEQQAGIEQTSSSSQAAQPYFGAATGLTMAGAQDVGALTPGQIGYYQNPYTEAVVAPTVQALQQQQGQQRAEQQAQAIKSGAAFGERANLARNDLMRQQALGTAQAVAPLYQQGFGQAAQIAAGQQGVVASDMARRLQAGQQLAGLGAGAQQAGIQGAQALLAAGTVGQQTQQADLTARYQEFLQKQGYPFQTAQFLANIAMGTGALSGSTTSTTQPAPFFSDERLKHDAKKIGETNDGLPIYSFKYNGDDRTQIGLMAQDVEKKKPEAVGLAPASDGRMYKTVDYDRATRAKKYAGGGLVGIDYDPSSMGGAVGPESLGEAFARGGYASGGPSILSSADHKALMAANVDPEAGPYAEHGIYKTPRNVIPGLGGSKINMGKAPPTPSLVTANPAGGNPAQQIGLGRQALAGIQTGKELVGAYDTLKSGYTGAKNWLTGADEEKARGGLALGRHAYALDGGVDDDKTEDQGEGTGVVIPGMKGGIPLGAGAKMAQLATAKSPTGGGQQRGPGNDIMDAMKLGSAAMQFGEGLGSLATMFLAQGGAAERKGYAGDDGESGAVVDPGLIVSPAAKKSIIAEGDVAEGGGDTTALAPARDVAPPATAPDYRAMVEAAAKQKGLDVGHAVRLAHGESGLRPVVGDDGSSAGLWQLHVGGLSKQYPNPGLGDEYFIQRRPDLAKKLSPAEKIAYLNAPENQADITDFATDHISKRGAGAWTVARNQGLFGLGGNGDEQPTGLTFGRSGPGKYSGKEASQASIGDVAGEFLPKSVPTTANFWVPALSGLGSMLSSKSPYLLGAVGEGLVGGVSGYQAQKKQEMEAVKNIFDMVKDRFTQIVDEKTGQIAFRDKFGGVVSPGQVQSSVAKILTDAGIDPAPYGLSRTQTADAGTRTVSDVGAGAGAGQPSQKLAEGAAGKPVANTEIESNRPKAQNAFAEEKPRSEWNPGDYEADILANPAKYGYKPGSSEDPNTRLKRVKDLQARAEMYARSQIPGAVAEANSLRAQAKNEFDEVKLDMEKKYKRDYELGLEESKKTLENANEYGKEIKKRADAYATMERQLLEISRLQAQGMKSGVSVELQQRMGSLIKNVFGQEPPKWLADSTQFQYAAKIAADQIKENIAAFNLGRAPASMSNLLERASASPNIDAGAVHELVGQTLGELNYARSRDNEYLTKFRGKDPIDFVNNYENSSRKERRMDRAVADAFNQIYLPTGEPGIDKLVRNLDAKYRQYGYDAEGAWKRTKEFLESGKPKTESPSAPAIPAPADRVVDQVYTTPKGNFRWKGTGWERAQ